MQTTYTVQISRLDIVKMPTPIGIWDANTVTEVNKIIREVLSDAVAEYNTIVGSDAISQIVVYQTVEGRSTEIARWEFVDINKPHHYRVKRAA